MPLFRYFWPLVFLASADIRREYLIIHEYGPVESVDNLADGKAEAISRMEHEAECVIDH